MRCQACEVPKLDRCLETSLAGQLLTAAQEIDQLRSVVTLSADDINLEEFRALQYLLEARLTYNAEIRDRR